MELLLFTSLLLASSVASAVSGQLTIEDQGASSYCNTSTKFTKLTQNACSTPAVIFFGKDNGDLVRCLQANRDECEVFHNASSAIFSLVISGEYIYAGLKSGEILKCHLNVKHSCKTFYSCHVQVHSLAAGRGYLFVGIRSEIMRCDLHQSGSCKRLHRVIGLVMSLVVLDKYIYAGLQDGVLKRCSVTVYNNCTGMYNMQSTVTGLAGLRNNIYAGTDDKIWKCSPGENRRNYCASVDSNLLPSDMKSFKNSLYVNDYVKGICQWMTDSCESYTHYRSAWSIDMAYGTYHMQSRFKTENTVCTQQGDAKCPLVVYYNEQQRVAMEVFVKDGRLYDSQDLLVDTSDADEGHSGPAGIFAMGPDGRILLSKTHGGTVRTSSLFAGDQVSGAGEVVVENGVIKKIKACSEHYLPDLELNDQVIQALLTQGYTDPIESDTC